VKRIRPFSALALAAAVLAGCAVPPAQKHETPQLELPAGRAVPEVQADWWKSFGDPQLDALVAEALMPSWYFMTANSTIRIAFFAARPSSVTRPIWK